MPSNTKGRGVLPVSAAQTKKPFKQQQPRPPAPRLRLIVRRLPPGLTEAEFWESIGHEWQVGKGKIDWAAFKAGKISKDLAKPSRPARAYLKVKEPAIIDSLAAHIKDARFQDAKNTSSDSCLIGPPTLEFAPYNKTPSTRQRHDGRQGSIDQDAEFIDFLQSLTEPITKSATQGDASEAKLDKVTITPLVQYIKDKKANKAKEKETAAAKKGQEGREKGTKDGKNSKEKTASPSKAEKTTVVRTTATTEAEKARVAKATQKTIDSIKKSVAGIQGQAPGKQDPKDPEKKDQTSNAASSKRERQRGDASAAARIIGRDLGLIPKDNRATRGQRAVTQPAHQAASQPPRSPTPAAKPAPTSPAPAAAPQSPSAPPKPPKVPRGPRNAPGQQIPPRAAATPPPPKAKPGPQPSPGAKSAFLKHANPSQGVTEELLQTTFSTFGEMTRCEIDRKKGLGYVDFVETEGLRKAMAASPIKIGNGQVTVLENRMPYKKVSQATPRSSQPSPVPNASTSSSPKPAQASLTSIAEQAQPQPAATIPQATGNGATSASSQITVAAWDESATGNTQQVSATPETVTAAGQTQPIASGQPANQTNSPATNRGGRGNGRGGFRGRAFRGGRGGQFRGGNRAVSTPNSNGNSSAPPNAPPGPAAG